MFNPPVMFCEKCAIAGIRELPQCAHLIIVTTRSPTGEATPQIRKEYRVLEADQNSNAARILVEDSTGPGADARRASFDIRYDAVPPHARAPGATFTVMGTPLEITLLEACGKAVGPNH